MVVPIPQPNGSGHESVSILQITDDLSVTGMASAREASVKAQRTGRNMMRLVVDREGWAFEIEEL